MFQFEERQVDRIVVHLADAVLIKQREIQLSQLAELLSADLLVECFGDEMPQLQYLLNAVLLLRLFHRVFRISCDMIVFEVILRIDDRVHVVIPVAVRLWIVQLQYVCYLCVVIVFVLEHSEAVGRQQPRIDSHDVLVIGQTEYVVLEDGAQHQVLFGPALHLQHRLLYIIIINSTDNKPLSWLFIELAAGAKAGTYRALRSMISNRYYSFINSHRFLTSKVAVCDLALQLSHSFTYNQLKKIATYVFRKIPKYAYIVLQKIVNQIFAKNIAEGQDRCIEEDVHYALVAVFIAKQSTFTTKDAEIFRDRAQQVFNRSMGQFGVNAKNILLRAYFQFYQGGLSQSLQLTKNLLEIVHPHQDSITWNCHLLTAQIYFARRLYQKCIDELKTCFRMHNDLPIKARIAMAHCYFHLGKYQMAEATFKRILALDPRCIDAVIGLAVICERNEDYEDYFHCLKIANKNHPLIILHLAQHFLIINELEKAWEFAERGLKAIKRMSRINRQRQPIRDDYFEYEGRFWNIVGQTYHIQGRHDKALRWYNLLSKKGVCCGIWNRYQSAQCFVGLQLHRQASCAMEALYQQYHDYFAKIYRQVRVLGDTYRLMAWLKVELELSSKKIENYFIQSVKFDKRNPQIHFELSQFYHLQAEPTKALVQFKHGYELMAAQKIHVPADIHNNLAVLYLENDQIEEAGSMLDQALQQLESQTAYDEPTTIAVKTVVLYNLGVVAEEKKSIESAIQIYQQSLQTNSLYLDAMLRLAYCYFQQNDKQLSQQVLRQALQIGSQRQQKSKMIDRDRTLVLKAYIQLEADQLQKSLQSIDQIKEEDSYSRLLKIGIIYHNLIRQPHSSNLDKFKQLGCELQAIAQQDTQDIFAISNLLAINLTIQHMMGGTQQQLKQYQVYNAFGQLKTHINKKYISQIDYNTALFSIRANNISSAASLLKELRKNNPTAQINGLSVYCQIAAKQLSAACKLAKFNVLLFPSDIVARYQLQWVVLRNCRERVDGARERSKGSQLARQLQQVRYCCRLFRYCGLIETQQYRISNGNRNSMVIDKLKLISKAMAEEAIACDLRCRQQLRNAELNHKRQRGSNQQEYQLKKRFKYNSQSTSL